MQNQLPAAHTLLSQKPANFYVLSNHKLGSLIGHLGKRQRIYFTLYLPQTVCFGLLRSVT